MKNITFLALLISGAYHLNAQCDGNLPVTDNFATNEIGVCWQVDDMDGDNRNWLWSSLDGGYVYSYSYSSTGATITPDNWIISYPIDLTSFSSGDNIQLSWKIRAELSWKAHEYYTVYAATGNQTNDFETSAVNNGGEYVDDVGGAGTFVTRTLDVSALAGYTIYIAFRHYNSTDQSAIDIDDVTVSTSALGIEDFNKENFKYYYSPNSETLTLKSSNKPISSIAVYNLLGQSVVSKTLSNTTENINLSALVDGIYIAQVEIDNTTKAIKFLKQ
jgi:hypothetical protein